MKKPLLLVSDVGVNISFYEHRGGVQMWFNPNLNNTYKKLLTQSELKPLSVKFLCSSTKKTNIVFKSSWFSKIWVTIKPIDDTHCKGSFCLGFGPWIPMTIYWFKIKKDHLESVGDFLNKIG